MDQGWAAIIGAAVGAAATGVTALAASNLHRRQGRREDYLTFLDAATRVEEAHRNLLNHFITERSPANAPLDEAEIAQHLTALNTAVPAVEKALPRVYLGGVRQVMAYASYTHSAALHIQALARRCGRNHMRTALPSDLKTTYLEADGMLRDGIYGFSRAARRKV